MVVDLVVWCGLCEFLVFLICCSCAVDILVWVFGLTSGTCV